MKLSEFRKLSREHFGRILGSRGFTCEGQKATVCWRQPNEDVAHFVVADLGRQGLWFDVRIFALSPRVEPIADETAKESVGAPGGGYLSVSGVGPAQQTFRCNTAQGFERIFRNEVEPALIRHGLSYLDRIQSLQTLLPTAKNPYYRGRLLAVMGKPNEGLLTLRAELDRVRRDPPGEYELMLEAAIREIGE